MNKPSTTYTGGTIIQPELHVKGGLVGRGNLTVGGTIEGNIDIKGLCAVDEAGLVIGDIHARTIVVKGKVRGNLFASEKVVIDTPSEVIGNVTTPSIAVSEGATLNGSVLVDRSPQTS